jgi:hypothetical protein
MLWFQSPAGSDEMRWKTWEGLPLLLEEVRGMLGIGATQSTRLARDSANGRGSHLRSMRTSSCLSVENRTYRDRDFAGTTQDHFPDWRSLAQNGERTHHRSDFLRIIGMNRPSLALAALVWTTASIFAQEPQLAIAKLEAPVYPPMARAARVWGDVILKVTLASDGNANAVTVESGPPMLRQAAINSATRSQFQANLENRTGGYRLVYRFVLD